MLGGFVSALLRPIQSIQQIVHSNHSSQPSTAVNKNGTIAPILTEQYGQQNGRHQKELKEEKSLDRMVDTTPIKPFAHSHSHSIHHSHNDPFKTPIHHVQPIPISATTLPTPLPFTPLPSFAFQSKLHSHSHALNRPFETIPIDEEQDQTERKEMHDLDEDKENYTVDRKRSANTSHSSRDSNQLLENDAGHQVKKPKLESTTTGVSPRRTRKSLGGKPIAAVQTASIFNFGPSMQMKAPLFTAKPKPKTHPTIHRTISHPPLSSSTQPQSNHEQLLSSMNGFQITASSTYPSRTTSTVPASVTVEDDVPMDDVPMDLSSPTTSSSSHAPTQTQSNSQLSHQPHPNGPNGATSPTTVLGAPLDSLTISPPITLPPLGSMTINDPSNPSSLSTDRARDYKASRERSRKENFDRLRSDREAEKQKALEEEAKQNGHRVDIKTRTRTTTPTLNSAHIPTRPGRTKPPVPVFTATVSADASSSIPNAPIQPIQPVFTPLVPDATFKFASASVPPPPPPSSHPSQPSSLPLRPKREAERVSINSSGSYRAVMEREEVRRREREAAKAALTKKTREAKLQQQREEAERRRQEQEMKQQQQAEQEAAAEKQQHQRRQEHQQSDAERIIAEAAATYGSQHPRRSARFSVSPSPSPSPNPPILNTPSPRNRFMTPPLSATPAHHAHQHSMTTPTNINTNGERRTRSSLRAGSPSINDSRATPSPRPSTRSTTPTTTSSSAASAAATAAQLSATIAARKLADSQAAASRLLARQASLRESELAAERVAQERDAWKGQATRRVAQRARGKGYEGLLREFAPQIRAELSALQVTQYDVLRKAMRKAMARYHPDKHTGSPTKNQLEAEETFVILKKAYDELCTLCR